MPQSFNVNILEEKENVFFNRKDLSFVLTYPDSGVPNRLEVKKTIAASKAADEKLVFIKEIKPRMGKHEAKGLCSIYADEKSAAIEPRYIRIRNMGKDQREEEKKKIKEEHQAKKAKSMKGAKKTKGAR